MSSALFVPFAPKNPNKPSDHEKKTPQSDARRSFKCNRAISHESKVVIHWPTQTHTHTVRWTQVGWMWSFPTENTQLFCDVCVCVWEQKRTTSQFDTGDVKVDDHGRRPPPGFDLLWFCFRDWLETLKEKVYEKYFTGIYSFGDVLEILCMRNKKNQDIFLLENLSKWYILMSLLKLIYFNCCSYKGSRVPI